MDTRRSLYNYVMNTYAEEVGKKTEELTRLSYKGAALGKSDEAFVSYMARTAKVNAKRDLPPAVLTDAFTPDQQKWLKICHGIAVIANRFESSADGLWRSIRAPALIYNDYWDGMMKEWVFPHIKSMFPESFQEGLIVKVNELLARAKQTVRIGCKYENINRELPELIDDVFSAKAVGLKVYNELYEWVSKQEV